MKPYPLAQHLCNFFSNGNSKINLKTSFRNEKQHLQSAIVKLSKMSDNYSHKK